MPYAHQKWNNVTVEAFDGGLNTSLRPEVIPDNDLLVALNVAIKQKRVLMDTGYKTFADEVHGQPQIDYQFFHQSGITELILITTETVYRYNTAADQWVYIPALTTTVTEGYTSWDNHDTLWDGDGTLWDVDQGLVLASVVGLTVGDYIGITLDDGSELQTHITSIVGNLITIWDSVPGDRYIPAGAVVSLALLLHGDIEIQVSVESVPSNDWIVFSNGVDIPKYYDGTVCATLPGLPAGFTTCRIVKLYNATLFLMNTTEGGTNFPQRIRRSNIGEPTNWTTLLSGYDDLYDGPGAIITAAILGPYLIVYREHSIVRGQYVNTNGLIYQWDTTIDGEGAVSLYSIVNLNSYHLVFGNAGIYSYTGSYDLPSVADKVFYIIFSEQGDLDIARKPRIFCFYVEDVHEAWFFYPTGAGDASTVWDGEDSIWDSGETLWDVDTACHILMRYNDKDKSWVRRHFVEGLNGFGFYRSSRNNRWLDLIGDWTAQTWNWNSKTVSTGSPTVHLMSADENVVREYDYVTSSDNSATITSIVESKDFFNKDFSIRFDTLQFTARGQEILVQYSTNSGETYHTLGTVSAAVVDIHTLSTQIICDKIRFRWTCSNPGFELGWMRMDYKEESTPHYRSVA